MRTNLVAALFAIAMVTSANAAIREEPVTYSDGEATMKGFVVYDDAAAAKQPGIVMVHEWWGITKHIHDEARNFAQQGYTVLIADMYGDAKTADNPKDAGALSSSVMKSPSVMEQRFNAARDQLVKQASVNPQRIGAVGYCFGGAVVLDLARSGADLKAAIAFHGDLSTDDPGLAKNIKARVLAMNGADDVATMPGAPKFIESMRGSGADWQFVVIGHAVHCFTETEATAATGNCRYNAKAAAQSYAMMRAWLAESFAAN